MGALFKKRNDGIDVVESGGKTGQQIFEGPTAGKAETRMPQGDVVAAQQPPADAAEGSDVASSIATLGLMPGAVYAKVRSNREQESQKS